MRNAVYKEVPMELGQFVCHHIESDPNRATQAGWDLSLLTLGKAAFDVQIIIVLAHDKVDFAHSFQFRLCPQTPRSASFSLNKMRIEERVKPEHDVLA